MKCDGCGKEAYQFTWVEGKWDYRKPETVLALCPLCYEIWKRKKQAHEAMEDQRNV